MDWIGADWKGRERNGTERNGVGFFSPARKEINSGVEGNGGERSGKDRNGLDWNGMVFLHTSEVRTWTTVI